MWQIRHLYRIWLQRRGCASVKGFLHQWWGGQHVSGRLAQVLVWLISRMEGVTQRVRGSHTKALVLFCAKTIHNTVCCTEFRCKDASVHRNCALSEAFRTALGLFSSTEVFPVEAKQKKNWKQYQFLCCNKMHCALNYFSFSLRSSHLRSVKVKNKLYTQRVSFTLHLLKNCRISRETKNAWHLSQIDARRHT